MRTVCPGGGGAGGEWVIKRGRTEERKARNRDRDRTAGQKRKEPLESNVPEKAAPNGDAV